MTAISPKGWGEIRVEVLRRIRERIWPPGELIPSEEALAVEFRCARATVNRALRELAEAGVLERRRKAGTRVTALPIRKATLDIPVIRQEVEARGEVHSFRLLQQVMGAPPVPVTARLGLPAGTKLLYVETLHLGNSAPFAHETRWLNPAAIEAELPSFATISANEWLVAHVSYHSGNIAFSAAPARPREAAVLGVKMGTALFITERETWTGTAPITLVRLAHVPGYRVQTTV